MPSQTHSLPITRSEDEVLVRVEGVSKKFCRSLKKSLWYGVCDIASELNPFGRNTGQSTEYNHLTTEGTESTERVAGGNQRADSAEFLEGHSQAGLQMDSEKLASIRSANDSRAFGEQTGSDSSSAEIGEICGQKNSIAPDGAGLRPGEFWAVKDVSFELRRGECLGLIGHNGAGKTTLLKMLNGLIKPDAGSITMRGRVGALIALGAGFNPILTGRENIYINGSVLGLSKKEIDAKIDEIIEFAEIREAIDMPVQNYSSGMSVRLGYSVASNLNPEILLVDEVLAVGDMAFQRKCMDSMTKYAESGGSLILVAHQMHAIQSVCDRCIVFHHGEIYFSGPTNEAVKIYHELQFSKDMQESISLAKAKEPSIDEPVVIKSVEVENLRASLVCTGDPMRIRVSYKSLIKMPEVDWGFSIWTHDLKTRICTATASWDKFKTSILQGEGVLDVILNELPLVANLYALRVGIYDYDHSWPLARYGWDEAPILFKVISPATEKLNRQTISNDIITIYVKWE